MPGFSQRVEVSTSVPVTLFSVWLCVYVSVDLWATLWMCVGWGVCVVCLSVEGERTTEGSRALQLRLSHTCWSTIQFYLTETRSHSYKIKLSSRPHLPFSSLLHPPLPHTQCRFLAPTSKWTDVKHSPLGIGQIIKMTHFIAKILGMW